MATAQIPFTKAAGVDYAQPLRHFAPGSTAGYDAAYTILAMPFPAIPDNLLYKNIKSVHFFFYATSFPSSNYSEQYKLSDIYNKFDADSATYDSLDIEVLGHKQSVFSDAVPGWIKDIQDIKSSVKFNGGVAIEYARFRYSTPYGSNKPYLEIDYDDEIAGFVPSAPSPSQYAPECSDQQFSWSVSNGAFTINAISIISAKLQWKQGNDTVHEIDAGTESRVVVPAGTFSAGTAQVRVAVTSNSGATKYSEWVSIEVLPPVLKDPTPSSGYVPKFKDSTFRWSLAQPTSPTYSKPITQSSAVFRWRESSVSTPHEIPVQGSETQVTIPSGTFSSDTIQWMVSATAQNGSTASSDWMTCSTVEQLSSARAISPKNTVVKSDVQNLFAWEHIIETGTLPTGYDLEYASGDGGWVSIASAVSSDTSALVPAYTLPGGTVQWRVRTYNTDDSPGTWSEPVSIIVAAPPSTPSIYIERSSPRFSIRWSQTGQEAYEVELDGIVVAQTYGATASYTYSDLAEPGTHTVRVRIQGKYGLWSEWGTASLTISNSASGSIALQAETDHSGDVTLVWSPSQSFTSYEVFRNGRRIHTTTGTDAKDCFAIGASSYYIRGVVDDAGNYIVSSAATVQVAIPFVQIASVENPIWTRLPYSTTDNREASLTASKAVTYQHFAGSALPSAVVGDALDQYYRFSCAIPYKEAAARALLESLIGKVVALKDPRGFLVIGVLDTYTRSESRFFVSYSCGITLIEWEDG